MTSMAELRFFATPAHECSYLKDRNAVTLFADPAARIDNLAYTLLSELGFRRSGAHIYRPHCENCSACIPVRVPVNEYKPQRVQRRIAKRNQDLSVTQCPAEFSDESYQLYQDYINQRHADGDMYPPDQAQFKSFLVAGRAETSFYEFRHRQQLVAVAVVDQLANGLSAIYTYFDPREAKRSLGVYAVLWQIERVQDQGLQYVYLGYWIQKSPKMNYKINFRPIEMFIRNKWIQVC